MDSFSISIVVINSKPALFFFGFELVLGYIMMCDVTLVCTRYVSTYWKVSVYFSSLVATSIFTRLTTCLKFKNIWKDSISSFYYLQKRSKRSKLVSYFSWWLSIWYYVISSISSFSIGTQNHPHQRTATCIRNIFGNG